MRKRGLCAILGVGAVTLAAVALALLGHGCGARDHGDQRVVARVGGSVLRMEDLRAAFPDNPRLGLSEAQVRSYVQRWINTELLAQEAQRRGLAQNPKVKRQLADLRREVLATAALEQESADSLVVTEEELRAYFEKHREAFSRAEDEYLLQEILVRTWGEATQLRTRLLSGENFDSLARESSLAPSAVQGGFTGYLRRIQMPVEVAQQVTHAPLERVLAPIKTEAGYYLIKVVDSKPAGSIRDFSEVRDLVRERVVIEKSKNLQRELLNRLRARRSVYVDYAALAEVLPDTTRTTP